MINLPKSSSTISNKTTSRHQPYVTVTKGPFLVSQFIFLINKVVGQNVLVSFNHHTISTVVVVKWCLAKLSSVSSCILTKSTAVPVNPIPLMWVCERCSERLIFFSLQRNSSTDREERVLGSGDRQRADTYLESTMQQAVLSRSQFSDVDFYLIKQSRWYSSAALCESGFSYYIRDI